MALERYYTPKALSEATGLNVSQCRTLIAQSPDRLFVSQNPNSRRPRWAISEKGFHALMEEHRKKALRQQTEAARVEEKAPNRQRKQAVSIPGLTPDGKIMNSRQLKAAGLWNR